MGQEVVAFNKCHDISPERAEATLNIVKETAAAEGRWRVNGMEL
jgi:hypothetical protein